MNIVKFKKLGKNKYKVFFDNEELILYEDVILKYNLLSKKTIDLHVLDNVLKDNSFYEVYNNALSYIEIKMRNKNELRNYLVKKEYESKDIDKVIEKLENDGFLNERNYVQAFINDRISLSLSGPSKIKNELINFNIDENIIDEILYKIDENIWLEKINKIINKKSKLNKKMSNTLFKKKLIDDLYYMGYTKEQTLSLINELNLNDEEIIKNEYMKAYNKYSKKYNDKELKKYIRNHLIKKGFDYEIINNLLNAEY
jgi:regulatory protein